MIDKKWILWCTRKKRNAYVSTGHGKESWESYIDLCSVCGHPIFEKHSQAHITETEEGRFVIVPEDKVKLKKKILWFNEGVKIKVE